MKLTPLQKRIVDEIIAGNVYDIPTYIKTFGKGQQKKCDISKIIAKFNDLERGITYSYRDDNGTMYTDIFNNGELVDTLEAKALMQAYLIDNPITVPIKAELKMETSPQIITWEGHQGSFDFIQNTYLVADSFEDIVDFIAIWSYLKREALIVEVDKIISSEDLSVFFECKHREIHPEINPYWQPRHTISACGKTRKQDAINLIPMKSAQCYNEDEWKFNYEHITMCREFIGKKMLATGSLQTFQKDCYKTFEEVSNRSNLIVAWIAVLISVVSVIIGNIIPLFDKHAEECLSSIIENTSDIRSLLNDGSVEETIISELQDIDDTLKNIDNDSEQIQNIIQKLDELKAWICADKEDLIE